MREHQKLTPRIINYSSLWRQASSRYPPRVPKRSRSEIIHKAVIDELQKERLRQGLSKYRLAQETGISLQGISLIERGQRLPTLHTLLRLAEALQVSLGDLIQKAEARNRV